MKNEFVPYYIALAMKELGFDEPCFGFYSLHDGNKAVGGNYPCDGTNSAPLYQQAFRWFRNVHEEYMVLVPTSFGQWWIKKSSKQTYGDKYDTYEEAQDACLRKLIEIVKDK